MSNLEGLFKELDKAYEAVRTSFENDLFPKHIRIVDEIKGKGIDYATALPISSVANQTGSKVDEITNAINSLSCNLSFLKLTADTEYSTTDRLYRTALQYLMTNSKILNIIAGQRPEFGILYNDPQLINSAIQVVTNSGELNIGLLRNATDKTPNSLLQEILNNNIQGGAKFYPLYSIQDTKLDLSNQARVILTNNGLKITKRGFCTYFLFKEKKYNGINVLPTRLQNFTSEIDEKVLSFYNAISDIVSDILNEEKLKQQNIFPLEFTKSENLPLSIGERQIVKAINGLGEEMAKLPNAIAQEMAKILQQSNKKDTDILDYIKKSAETSDAILKFLNTATKLGS